jgi:hypothetical protein
MKNKQGLVKEAYNQDKQRKVKSYYNEKERYG